MDKLRFGTAGKPTTNGDTAKALKTKILYISNYY